MDMHVAESYYRNVVPFQAQRAQRYRRWFRIMACTTAVSVSLMFLQAAAIIQMLPLVRSVPFFIGYNDDGTKDEHIVFSALPPSQRVAAIEATLWNYVRLREGWVQGDADYAYDVVSSLSAPKVRAQYQEFINSKDQENPAIKIGKNGTIRALRISGGFLPGHADDYSAGTYEIGFCRVVRIDGAKPTAQRMVVDLEYQEVDKIPLVDRVNSNPEGVVVTSYPGATDAGAPMRREQEHC